MELRKDSIANLFIKYGGVLEGHFLLSSGLHSDKYFQCAVVLQYPDIAEKVAMLLIEEIRNKIFIEKINVVISPALGGIVIGQEVARVIKTLTANNVRAIFAERDNEDKLVLRRGFNIYENEKVLIVEDVITTGKTTKEIISLVKSYKGDICCISSIFYRGEEIDFGYPYFYIEKLKVNNYKPEECPLCKNSIPIIKPGSRKIV